MIHESLQFFGRIQARCVFTIVPHRIGCQFLSRAEQLFFDPPPIRASVARQLPIDFL
jgi:hypothetical protein